MGRTQGCAPWGGARLLFDLLIGPLIVIAIAVAGLISGRMPSAARLAPKSGPSWRHGRAAVQSMLADKPSAKRLHRHRPGDRRPCVCSGRRRCSVEGRAEHGLGRGSQERWRLGIHPDLCGLACWCPFAWISSACIAAGQYASGGREQVFGSVLARSAAPTGEFSRLTCDHRSSLRNDVQVASRCRGRMARCVDRCHRDGSAVRVGKFLIGIYIGKQGLESTFSAAASLVFADLGLLLVADCLAGCGIYPRYARRHGACPLTHRTGNEKDGSSALLLMTPSRTRAKSRSAFRLAFVVGWAVSHPAVKRLLNPPEPAQRGELGTSVSLQGCSQRHEDLVMSDQAKAKSFRREAENTARDERSIRPKSTASASATRPRSRRKRPCKLASAVPRPNFRTAPRKPGIESDLEQAPMFGRLI